MTARDCKAEAKRRLSGQALLALILASLAILAAAVGWMVCVDGFYALLDWGVYVAIWPTLMEVIRALALLGGWWLLLFPMAAGMRDMARALLDGGQAELGAVFAPFGSWRSLGRAWGAIWPFRRGFWRLLGFRLSFLPWVLLGLAGGGVLLILFVIPYFTLADVLYLRTLRPISHLTQGV